MAVQEVAGPALAGQGSTWPTSGETLLNVEALGEYLGISPHTIRIWRMEGTGPRAFKINGRLVRWRKTDVDAWLESQREAA